MAFQSAYISEYDILITTDRLDWYLSKKVYEGVCVIVLRCALQNPMQDVFLRITLIKGDVIL